jgi:hypothetical protein
MPLFTFKYHTIDIHLELSSLCSLHTLEDDYL